jgi:hypothetical protein
MLILLGSVAEARTLGHRVMKSGLFLTHIGHRSECTQAFEEDLFDYGTAY